MIKPYLNTFLAVCRTGSFTRAAASLFITPSAVTQQINAMEKDLSITLFIRGPRGVTLTEAGKYLYVHGEELVQKNKELLSGMEELISERNVICVGTSLMEKCRLLYELWILFSEQEKNYQIRMTNIDSMHVIPERTDLIESVNGEVPWTKNWNFMEICRVPFGFAFHKSHPFYNRKTIRLEELEGETVVSLNRGSSKDILGMLEKLDRGGIHVRYLESSSSSKIWECAFQEAILVVPICWEDILINMHMCTCDWEDNMPYGFFYQEHPSPAVQKFLEFVQKTYQTAGNVQGRVPVLTEW
ncbi:MAG: LysR family transcriptional regulator [Lachnospiraceae bacterium]|nr:LysR family transcriptional regulator [Lachnospiraceae bacterium]